MKICSKIALAAISKTFLICLVLFPVNTAQSQEIDDACQIPLVEIILLQDFGRAFFCAGEQLQQNPNDIQAQLIFARAAQETGQFDVAISFANLAREHQLSEADRFASYLISGMAHAGQGNFISANLDLRRGSDFANTEIEKKIVTQAIESVGQMSPWQYSLGLGIKPSTNVNGGSMHDTMTWFGSTANISEDGQAQRGIGYTFDANVTHAKPLSPNLHWENKANVSATLYKGPGQPNAQYSLTSGLRFSTKESAVSQVYGYIAYDKLFVADASASQSFENYHPYYSQTSFGVEYHRKLDTESAVKFYTLYSDRISDISSLHDAQISTVGGTFTSEINNIGFTVSGSLANTASNSADIASVSQNLALGVDWAMGSMPVTLTGDLGYTHTSFKEQVFGYTDKHVDDQVTLELSLTHNNIQFMGLTQ